jgi:hypothetical protein
MTNLGYIHELLNEVHNLYGIPAVCVGGAVRDAIIMEGVKDFLKNVNDFDLATVMTPDQMVASIKAHRDNQYSSDSQIDYSNINNGVIKIQVTLKTFGRVSIDIATFRTEEYPHENSRVPVLKFTTDITKDLMRRDFTVNSIVVTMEGEIIDPYLGIQDIMDKKLRVIQAANNIETRMTEDPLRLLRMLRYAMALDYTIVDLEKILPLAHLVSRLSKEKSNSEWDRIMSHFYYDYTYLAFSIQDSAEDCKYLFEALFPISYPSLIGMFVAEAPVQGFKEFFLTTSILGIQGSDYVWAFLIVQASRYLSQTTYMFGRDSAYTTMNAFCQQSAVVLGVSSRWSKERLLRVGTALQFTLSNLCDHMEKEVDTSEIEPEVVV